MEVNWKEGRRGKLNTKQVLLDLGSSMFEVKRLKVKAIIYFMHGSYENIG